MPPLDLAITTALFLAGGWWIRTLNLRDLRQGVAELKALLPPASRIAEDQVFERFNAVDRRFLEIEVKLEALAADTQFVRSLLEPKELRE